MSGVGARVRPRVTLATRPRGQVRSRARSTSEAGGALAHPTGTNEKRSPMARVPLLQEPDHPELADLMEKYRAGRRGRLINIYRMLLNSPPLAESWFNHSNAVRW